VDCIAGLTCTPDPITITGTIGIGAGQVTDGMLANNYSGVGACGVNTWASTLNDNAAPTCTQPAFSNLSGSATDAQIPDTITLTDITQITNRDHGSLTGLADDDHTQYLLLAGRAGGQSATGGTATADALTLKANAIDTTSLVLTGSDTADITATTTSTTGLFRPRTVVANNPGTMNAIEWLPSYTVDDSVVNNVVRFMQMAPTVTINGPLGHSLIGFTLGGTLNVTTNPVSSNSFNANLVNSTVNFNGASSATGWSEIGYRDAVTYNAGSVAAGTITNNQPFVAAPVYKATGAAGSLTVTNAYGFRSTPAIQTTTAGGVSTVDTMIHFQAGATTNSGAGTETLTTEIGLDVPAFALATNKIGIRSAGTANEIRWAGPAVFGVNAATISPVIVEVQQPTVGSEVMRVDSLATNDDPTEQVFQCRAATTDATVTDCKTIAVTSTKVRTMQATVVAHCTGGVSCATDNGAEYTIVGTCKNNAGTTTAIAGSPDVIAASEDVAGWDATVDCDDTGDTIRLRVTGAATTNITWHATIRTMEVGT
jgi:hypothetical protein